MAVEPGTQSSSSLFLCRRRRTSSTRAQDAAWPPTSWASVIATTTTSCCAPQVTCSTSTLGNSWATPRCLAALRGGATKVLWACVNVKGAGSLQTGGVVCGWSQPCFRVSMTHSESSALCPRRDRAPFVLTSDMAYVINGGERPTSRFQLFVDLCCQAYNLIRKHSGLFLNLLSLVRHTHTHRRTHSQV